MLKHPPQPIGACVLLFNAQHQLLLGKRKNSYGPGYYGLPGGRIELNEPLETAIIREIAEETGMSVGAVEYVGVVRENQEEYDFIHFVFAAHDVEQEPTLCEPDKCEGWVWVDVSALVEPILPGHKAAIEMYLERKRVVDICSNL